MRNDLLALTPQALAQLANMGLVKRAQRELAEGLGPSLSESDDGTVTGVFPDKVIAKLPPSTPLKEAPCTCGATAVCRHRVAVALAYGPWYATLGAGREPSTDTEGKDDESAKEESGALVADGPSPARDTGWSPGEITDDTLATALGPRILERSRRTLARGLVVTVEHTDVPTAKLPSCTVKFLVPRDVAYARCDCVDAGGACEHLALAVWAFREADKKGVPSTDPEGRRARAVVAIGGGEAVSSSCRAALGEALALAEAILARGIEGFKPAPTRFAQVKAGLARESVVWAHDLVADLEIAIEGYHARSALYGTREIVALLVELVARARAGVAEESELPARFVLGQGEAPETQLDHVRLVSLGARLRADGRLRFADIFLADPDTATVLVLRKRWDYDEKTEPEDGPALGHRKVSAQVSLRALAHGQLVSKVVRRLANRSIELGTSRAAQSSVTPQTGDHSALGAPLLVRDLRAHAAWEATLPLRELRPRVLAEDVHVVELASVREVAYSAAEQRVFAVVTDAAGNDLRVTLGHRRVAPNAVDATIAALESTPRFVSGTLARSGNGYEMTPLSISGAKLVVPDLADKTACRPVPSFVVRASSGAHEDALVRAESVLEELCSIGLESVSRGAISRLKEAENKLGECGLVGLSARLAEVHVCLTTTPKGGDTGSAARAWLAASLRARLTREAISE